MAASYVKLRMLYIMKILLQKTDENHAMSAADIERALHDFGMSADRKTIYSDIETLREFRMDILQTKGTKAGYYVASRDFELPELKLLVDAVQSSKFITSKKSAELIGKLECLTSENEAVELRRNVFIYNRPKTGNETIYYNVDQIHTAIMRNRQISFQYAEWTVKKELRPRRNGQRYIVSPWALTWGDENYYLIAYDQEADMLKHYRVDKMQKAEIEKEERLGKEKFQDFDLAEFAKKTFAMYGGKDETVTLLCKNELVGVILDRFGKNVMVVPQEGGNFKVHVSVTVSPQFFGWVTGVGKGIQISEPLKVKRQYEAYLEEILQKYREL